MVVIGAIMCLAWPLRAQFAYVANLADNTVSGYSIDRKTGALTAVPGSPFVTGGGAVAVDPTGRFAYVTQLMP
jgi:6-phosphogluconolactonase